MKAVFKFSNKKPIHKVKFHKINEEPWETICFSSLIELNNKNNLEPIKNFKHLFHFDNPSSTGCYQLKTFKKKIFGIETDRYDAGPNIHEVTYKNKTKFFFNCSDVDPDDFVDYLMVTKKRQKVSEFLIKDNTLVIFLLPGSDCKNCKTKFTNKEIKSFSSNFNNFITDRIKKNKLLKFKVPNGTYVVNSYESEEIFNENFEDTHIVGHTIELKN